LDSFWEILKGYWKAAGKCQVTYVWANVLLGVYDENAGNEAVSE
jgi:hypothetical protein